MRASAPAGVTGAWRPDGHVDLPLIPSRRGRRPRRPAFLPPSQRRREAQQNAEAAPAEREVGGIRALPGPEVSPRVSRFIQSETRKGQPSLAGGRRYALRADRPAEAFFSLGPGAAHSLFGKTKKRMGGALSRPTPISPRPNGRIPAGTPQIPHTSHISQIFLPFYKNFTHFSLDIGYNFFYDNKARVEDPATTT